ISQYAEREYGKDGNNGTNGKDQRGNSVCSVISVFSVFSLTLLLRRSSNPGLLPDRMQPMVILRSTSGDNFEERLLNGFRDGTSRAVADCAPVNFADRRDLDRRAGQERFVGVEQLVERQRADFDFVTQVARNLNC